MLTRHNKSLIRIFQRKTCSGDELADVDGAPEHGEQAVEATLPPRGFDDASNPATMGTRVGRRKLSFP
jgi:hypothetical protein